MHLADEEKKEIKGLLIKQCQLLSKKSTECDIKELRRIRDFEIFSVNSNLP